MSVLLPVENTTRRDSSITHPGWVRLVVGSVPPHLVRDILHWDPEPVLFLFLTYEILKWLMFGIFDNFGFVKSADVHFIGSSQFFGCWGRFGFLFRGLVNF